VDPFTIKTLLKKKSPFALTTIDQTTGQFEIVQAKKDATSIQDLFYDNILKLVNYTTVICFHVIVRLINYFSIKEYLSGRIILLIIPLFND
jgi:hypothetical protein